MEPLIRPLHRDESELLEQFVDQLSPRSRHLRFHGPIPKLPPVVRRALLDVDDTDRIGLVAGPEGGAAIGIAHLIRTRGPVSSTEAEVAIAVADAWHRRGVGRRLLEAVTDRAREVGIERVTARVLPENAAALGLFRATFPVLLEHRDRDALVLTALLGGVEAITEEDILADLVA
jgi:GNAT superfamily N-acetyltransferase